MSNEIRVRCPEGMSIYDKKEYEKGQCGCGPDDDSL